ADPRPAPLPAQLLRPPRPAHLPALLRHGARLPGAAAAGAPGVPRLAARPGRPAAVVLGTRFQLLQRHADGRPADGLALDVVVAGGGGALLPGLAVPGAVVEATAAGRRLRGRRLAGAGLPRRAGGVRL